jgi:Subtilase family
VPRNLGSLRLAISSALYSPPFSAVVNVSQAYYDLSVLDTWKDLIMSIEGQRMFFVVSAGDHANPIGEKNQPYPTTLTHLMDNAISVAALNDTGTDLWKTNSKEGSDYGPEIEIAAPGEKIPCATHVENNSAFYALTKGSSMSAALVSRVAARLLQEGLDPTEIKGRLLASSDYLDSLKKKVKAGRLNVSRALLNTDKAHLWLETNDGKPNQMSVDLAAVKD